jgi:hypothetical protein
MKKDITVNDLKRLCYAKHGEAEARHLAARFGSVGDWRTKKLWYKVLHHDGLTDSQRADLDRFRDSIIDRLDRERERKNDDK